MVLSFGTAEGAENVAVGLVLHNATTATATLPRLLGATSLARADVTLTDVSGRTAFLWQAFEYDPGWEPYAVTLGLFVALAFLGCYVVPAFVASGCEGSAWREKVVWKTLSKQAELQLYASAKPPQPTTAAPATAAAAPPPAAEGAGWMEAVMVAFGLGRRPAAAQTDLV